MKHNPNYNYKTILGGFLSWYEFEIQIFTVNVLILILNILIVPFLRVDRLFQRLVSYN